MLGLTQVKTGAYEFAAKVDHAIETLSDEDYHRRIGSSKVLREELYPLSRLALHLKQPGLEVEVEAFGDSGRPDGHIRVTGFRERDFEVQVTYAGYAHEDALRAELLATEGFSPGAGEIRKERASGKIVAIQGGVDLDEHVARIATTVRSRFDNKVAKPYARGTVLLIAFEDLKLYGRESWSQLFSALDGKFDLSGSPFASVYLFNGSTNELHRAA